MCYLFRKYFGVSDLRYSCAVDDIYNVLDFLQCRIVVCELLW